MNARSIDDLYDFVEKKKALPSPLFFHGLCREVKELERQITATQEELQEAREVIAVYADKENWHCRVEDSYSGLINEWTAQGIDTDSDEDVVNGEWQGGKRARVFLSKYPRETTSAQDAR